MLHYRHRALWWTFLTLAHDNPSYVHSSSTSQPHQMLKKKRNQTLSLYGCFFHLILTTLKSWKSHSSTKIQLKKYKNWKCKVDYYYFFFLNIISALVISPHGCWRTATTSCSRNSTDVDAHLRDVLITACNYTDLEMTPELTEGKISQHDPNFTFISPLICSHAERIVTLIISVLIYPDVSVFSYKGPLNDAFMRQDIHNIFIFTRTQLIHVHNGVCHQWQKKINTYNMLYACYECVGGCISKLGLRVAS